MVDARRRARSHDYPPPAEHSRAAEQRAAAAMLGELQQMLSSANAPADVLAMLDGSHNPDHVLQQLADEADGQAHSTPRAAPPLTD